MMSSAMGGADFEYLKTADIREKYMEEEEQEDEDAESPAEKKKKKVVFGNDLDNIEMEPGFQIWTDGMMITNTWIKFVQYFTTLLEDFIIWK